MCIIWYDMYIGLEYRRWVLSQLKESTRAPWIKDFVDCFYFVDASVPRDLCINHNPAQNRVCLYHPLTRPQYEEWTSEKKYWTIKERIKPPYTAANKVISHTICRKCWGNFAQSNAQAVVDGIHWLKCWEHLSKKAALSVFHMCMV